MHFKTIARKVWHFLWKDNSIWSWLANLAIAFVLVKFILYPGMGLFFGTNLPVVAVVSSSMEHHPGNFDAWWEENKQWYLDRSITKSDFMDYRFKNGFNKGDIMVIFGAKNVNLGDVVVYNDNKYMYPIIHRVVKVDQEYITKGDNNSIQDPKAINTSQIVGKAVFRIPLLGWIKIWFVDLIKMIGGLL
ncbi:MAG: signal peptidase I [Candidatus Nanoarchaeia archaeon]|nr:signal peptidase I [Candidatus Nanoarchaeia archaeon]